MHLPKKAKKLLKKRPELIPLFRKLLETLSTDPMHPKLKTHKLKGDLSGSYSCSLNYEIRVIFNIFNDYSYNNEKTDIIFLQTIGTHDELSPQGIRR